MIVDPTLLAEVGLYPDLLDEELGDDLASVNDQQSMRIFEFARPRRLSEENVCRREFGAGDFSVPNELPVVGLRPFREVPPVSGILRVLAANPFLGVRGPEPGDDRQGQVLYSDELLLLLRGEPRDPERVVGVPLYRRQTYAMAVYTKTRASELEAVTVDDVDLERATIAITKQADRKSKARKATRKTKTKRARTIDIEPNLLPLAAALVNNPQGKNGRLLRMPPPEDRAELLRKDLHTVGVMRAALFIEGDPVERAVTFHDLRDTGLTHMAVRGDSPIVIQWAGGHSDFKATQGYLDRGKVEARRIGEPLPPLPAKLLRETGAPAKVIAPESSGTISHVVSSRSHAGMLVTPTGIEPVLPT